MKRFSLKFFLMLLVCLGLNNICSAQGQWQQVGENGLVAPNAMEQSLAFDNAGTPYIVYHDKANGFRATVKKFDGGSWTRVGEAGISTGFAKSLSLVVDGNTPYVAYIDNGNEARTVIKKFNGNNWVNVGTFKSLVDHTSGLSLALDSKGNPYVAFQIKGNEGRAVVKKFNGSSWVNVGPAGFTKSYANDISLVFDGNDVPYVSLIDEGLEGKAVIKKFNGKKWENLNSTGLPDNYVTELSLAFDGKSTPYIVYRDETTDYKATVKKYKGSSWEDVGTAGFSAGKVQHTKLVVASNGTPYVAYVDFGNGAIDKVGTTNVRKFDGRNWQDVSPNNIKTINNLKHDFDLALALDSDGVPYLAYSNKANGSKATVLKLSSTATQNKRPVAKAGANKTITLPTKTVELEGKGIDDDGTISSYTWKQVSGPKQAKFSSLKVASPTVSGLIEGVYVFSLTTKDNDNASSAPDQVTITVLEREVPNQKVVSFVLIDAETKKDLQILKDGATITLASLPTNKLSIRAVTNREVGSVIFELTGEQEQDIIENIAPYELSGDNDTWTPAIGDYTLKATPYELAGGKGTEGNELEISFSVIKDNSDDENGTNFPATQQIVSFTLVNAENGQDIRTIANGATINMADLPTEKISIRVNTKSKGGSVNLKLSGKLERTQMENILPFALFGGNNGKYNPWTPAEGSYTLEATPYNGYSGTGTAGTPVSINFKVVDRLGASASSQMQTARKKQEDVKETLSGNTIAVYPNPTASKLHVEVSEAGEGIATLNLLDVSGRKVLTKQLATSANLTAVLDVDHLNPGVYILVINTSKGRISRRVVIQ